MLLFFLNFSNLRLVLFRISFSFLFAAYAAMFLPFLFFVVFLLNRPSSIEGSFIFDGFAATNLSLDGVATITSDGILVLSNPAAFVTGHAFVPDPFRFRPSAGAKPFSFSTTFVVAIVIVNPTIGGSHGLAFVISPSKNFSTALSNQYLGLLNLTSNGQSYNHLLAVELDTIQSPEFLDIDSNHLGIDVNSLQSNASHSAGYFADNNGEFHNLTLLSGDLLRVWVEYDSGSTTMNVTLAPVDLPKPGRPLLSMNIDLSGIMQDWMYVGFSSATGPLGSYHYVLGWSFAIDETAQELDLSKLPHLPATTHHGNNSATVLAISLSTSAAVVVLASVVAVGFIVRRRQRRQKNKEVVEDWELEYGPHRFRYKELSDATEGFSDEVLLGSGGFGRVYRGLLQSSKVEVAIKKFSHESNQGVKEFVAEIMSMGQLCHRNLVPLLGYCRHDGELLLVYDYMPNGSLDKFLHSRTIPILNWAQRFQIIKGVASGLLYLHEEWEQVVIHRDIKASNVLLDADMNGRLGDFGLARLHERGDNSYTTRVAGTLGYLAPELISKGKATTATDVFAFGAFLLEVACGQRPVDGNEVMLVDLVFDKWRRGEVIESRDPRMGDEFEVDELERVLHLGLYCSHPLPGERPSMGQVVQYLNGEAPIPELPYSFTSFSMETLFMSRGLDGVASRSQASNVDPDLLSGPR